MNETTKGREKSDGRIVPKGRRKAVPTAKEQGGKAATVNEQAGQLELNLGTADSPRGDVARVGAKRDRSARSAVPKPRGKTREIALAMTMEEVARSSNLRRAFTQVKSNDGAPGPDRESVEDVKQHLKAILPKLQHALLAGKYEPGQIRRVWIPKAGGGQRGLGIPNVIDRLVQQAVQQVLSPNYDPSFHRSSHGFRPGKSCHTAIAEARVYVEEGNDWVVDIDLEKFFDRVNHDRLMSKLAEKIKDDRLLRLIRKMLRAKVVMPDGVVVSTDEGTPQGGPLSPLLSNIVLDELDRELAQRGHHFVRYADDCNIYVSSERAGQRVMASITKFIEGRLRLKVNQEKSAVARPEERHFLGFRLRREPLDGSVEVLLSKRSRDRINEKVRKLTPRSWGQSLSACIQKINEYVTGWIGFFRICTESEERTMRNIDAHLRRRLRAIQLRHWKRRRTIAKRLIARGIKPATAWITVYKGRRSWWALTGTAAVNRGMRNASFAKRGLVSLAERWQYWQQREYIASLQQMLFAVEIVGVPVTGAGLR